MRQLPCVLATLLFLALSAGVLRGNDQKIEPQPFEGKVDFARDVMPILQQNCVKCHGPKEQKGKLRLDSRTAVLEKGGLAGPAAVAGKPTESPVYIRVSGIDEFEDRMPPRGALTPKQVGVIKAWIEQGAHWPKEVGSKDATINEHWAYVKPQRPALPKVSNADWPRNAIDHFVLAKLDGEGLEPSPPADRAKLLRRVHLDLIGLPPTVEEVEAFLADDSPDAYEKVVDRLLASPRFGEKWARHWLDLARYADSNGFQADQLRDSWAYRDWVIDAFNADMPFDQFTIEQLAGDLLPNATVSQRIATGFHRTVTCNVEAGVHPEENRVNQIFDRVNTTGTVWLGTTMECAQCHNHKYDPVTMKDYYQLFAYFNNTPLEVEQEGKSVTWNFYGPKMDLPLTDEQQARKAEIAKQIAAANEQLEAVRTKALAQRDAWEKRVLAASKNAPTWHVLEVAKFESKNGASHEILDDHSVLVGGKKPNTDVYTVTVHTQRDGITAFKLETLTHDSLPGKGPGRHHPERPNFVLYEFSVKAGPRGGKVASPVAFSSAVADYSQPNYDVAGLIDNDDKTGWAIHQEFHKPHEATLFTAAPLRSHGEDGTTFVVTLPQHHGEGRTIGRLRLSAMTGDPGSEALPADIVAILQTPAAKRNENQQQKLNAHFLKSVPEIKKLEDRIAALAKQRDAIKPHTTLVMVELDKPRDTHILRRGEYLTPAEQVSPGTPATLHDIDPDLPRNRLGLAKWLVDKDNPLTARVTVNRFWHEIFGQGLVSTLEDFGSQSDPPTHPQLLDWLAVEFVEGTMASSKGMASDPPPSQGGARGGSTASNVRARPWSMKHILRLIVTSAAYRQSSRVTRQLVERDPGNALYARGPRFRMSAELVRDNALKIAGLLSTKQAGPPVMPPQPDGIWRHVGRNAPKWKADTNEDRYRRGIYIVWRRSAPYPSMVNFDAPDRAACTVNRPRTNTPLQALTLLNDPAYVEIALAFAHRMMTDRAAGDSLSQRIDYGFRLCTSRRPDLDERAILESIYQAARDQYQQNAKAADELISGVPGWQPPANSDKRELAAWFHVANALLNLDETITKE